MTLDEALEYVAEGGKVTSASLSNGAVLKQVWQPHLDFAGEPMKQGEFREPGLFLRVVFELTGDSYDFQNHEKDQIAIWHKVEGWADYGN